MIFVKLILDCNTTKFEKVKSSILDYLDQKGISYNIVDDNSKNICICIGKQDDESFCFNSSIIISSCNKDVYRIHPNEIIYITIEQRKSVLYLTDNRRIETNYHIDYWKDVLNKNTFAQPHYSYLVNLNYVCEASKDFVKLKCGKTEYSVYTSSRKINGFKRTFLKFNK